MAYRNILCLAADGLRPDFLGAYGNSLYATPALDRLAAEGRVFDFAFSRRPSLEGFYQSAWLGESIQRPRDEAHLPGSLLRIASDCGYCTMLITDDRRAAELPSAADFAEAILVENAPATRPVDAVDESAVVRLLATAAEWVAQQVEQEVRLEQAHDAKPWLLWVHVGAITRSWDAPLGPSSETDEPDQQLSASTDLPRRRLDAATGGIGPEELAFWRDRYADQVEALDCGMELLVESLAAMQQLDETLFILAGCRGFPLGEHGLVGLVEQPLFEELIHIPLVIRMPDCVGRAQRTSQLVADIDIAATVAEACGFNDARGALGDGRSLLPLLRGDAAQYRDAIFFQSSDGDRAIRTADWYLRLPRSSAMNPPSTSDAQPKLYSKPDDRWDANEISGLCGDAVAELSQRLSVEARSCSVRSQNSD